MSNLSKNKRICTLRLRIIIQVFIVLFIMIWSKSIVALQRDGNTVILQSSDCTADNTALIQNQLDDSTISLIILQDPAGSGYSSWLTGPLFFAHDGTELHLEAEVTLETKTGSFNGIRDSLLTATNKNNIKVTGHGTSTLKMHKLEYAALDRSEWRYGISIRNCDQVTVENIIIQEAGGDCIGVGRDLNDSVGYSSNITINNVICDGAGRNGLSVFSVENLMVTNTTFKNSQGIGNVAPNGPWAGVDIEPDLNTERLENIVFDNCTFSGNGGAGFLTHQYMLSGSNRQVDITVKNCTMINNGTYGVYLSYIPSSLDPLSTITFTNTNIRDNENSGIYVINNSGSQIKFKDSYLKNNNCSTGLAPVWIRQTLQYVGGNICFEDVCLEENNAANCLYLNAQEGSIANISGTIFTTFSQAVKTTGLTTNITTTVLSSLYTNRWKLDETSGSTAWEFNGCNGTLYNMDSPSCWSSGLIGNSLFFDGIDDYVKVTDSNVLDIGINDFTITAWFYRESSNVINQRLLCKGSDAYGNTGYAFAVSNTSITGLLRNGPISRNVSGAHLGVDQWNHAAFVIDRDGDMTLYINGLKVSSTSISDWEGDSLSNAYDLYLGSNFGVNCFWTGMIDDVRIYKRKLSSPEVMEVFNNRTYVALPGACWKLDETSGPIAYELNGHDGTLYNMDIPSCWVNGSLSFDGINDYVEVLDSNDLDIGTEDFTVSAWFYRQPSNVINQRLICKGSDADGRTGYAFAVSDTSITGLLRNGPTSRSIVGNHSGVNKWNHVVFVIDRDSDMTLYVNGMKASSTSISDWEGDSLSNTYNLYLGSNFGVNCFWTGMIDDVRVYKRRLSTQEITELYNEQTYIPPVPVASWELDETSGTTAYELNGHDGTLYNMDVPACWANTGLLFDGINDYVEVPDASDLDVGTEDITIMTWFYRQPSTVINQRLICKGADGDGRTGYAFAVSDTSITALLRNGSTLRSISAIHLGVDQWNHVALVLDRDDDMTLYINGVKASSTSISDWDGQSLSNAYNFYLGSNFGVNCFWTGMIDDVRIYKQALSDNDIFRAFSDK